MTVGASECRRTWIAEVALRMRLGITTRIRPTRIDAPTTRQNTWRDRRSASRIVIGRPQGTPAEDRRRHDLALDADHEQADPSATMPLMRR